MWPVGMKRTPEMNSKISLSLKGRKFSKEHKKNLSKAAIGRKLSEAHKNKIKKSMLKNPVKFWLGKKRLNIRRPSSIYKAKDGYVLEKIYEHPRKNSSNYIHQHILVAEKKIGRYLIKGEVVHHINGIRDDNRAENLIVMTRKKHGKIHGDMKQKGKCSFPGCKRDNEAHSLCNMHYIGKRRKYNKYKWYFEK